MSHHITISSPQRTTNTSHVSSLATSMVKTPTLEINQLKDHLQSTISDLRQEFEEFKASFCKDFLSKLNQSIMEQTVKTNKATDILTETAKTMKEELKLLHANIHVEIAKQIQEDFPSLADALPKPAKRHKGATKALDCSPAPLDIRSTPTDMNLEEDMTHQP